MTSHRASPSGRQGSPPRRAGRHKVRGQAAGMPVSVETHRACIPRTPSSTCGSSASTVFAQQSSSHHHLEYYQRIKSSIPARPSHRLWWQSAPIPSRADMSTYPAALPTGLRRVRCLAAHRVVIPMNFWRHESAGRCDSRRRHLRPSLLPQYLGHLKTIARFSILMGPTDPLLQTRQTMGLLTHQ